GADQFDADHQAAAADLPYDVESGRDGPQPLDEQTADAPGVALEVVFEEVGEVGEARGHGDGAAAEGGNGVRGQGVHDLGAGDDAAEGHAVADALGEGQQVRRAVVGVCLPAPEVVAGAAPAGLHLVADPEDAVAGEDLAEGGVEAVGGRGEAADALDRFGDQGGDAARG